MGERIHVGTQKVPSPLPSKQLQPSPCWDILAKLISKGRALQAPALNISFGMGCGGAPGPGALQQGQRE